MWLTSGKPHTQHPTGLAVCFARDACDIIGYKGGMLIDATRACLGHVPMEVSLDGRLFQLFRRAGRRMHVPAKMQTSAGIIAIDPQHLPQRLLAYCFENVLRHYRRSPLGQLIKTFDGGTFIDVGANLGMYSLIARQAGLDSFAIEPEPRHATFLRRNAAIFGPSAMVAAGQSSSAMPLYRHPSKSGATSLVPYPSFRRTSAVPVEALTSIAEREGYGDEVRLIKIDVEGFEASVVEGMRGFLDQGHRPQIWCEVRGDKNLRAPGSCRHVTGALSDYGYRAEVPESKAKSGAVFDLLFTA